ncbi:MAG: hypothetical protein P1U61_06700 [Legionellaceae bacterium]|nr:hypothetical protein [Legionellaceae bacterium]
MTEPMLDVKACMNTPGEHYGMLSGEVGLIEARLLIPDEPKTQYFALLGHPHSLKGGSMQNKVVTTLARMFRVLGIPNLRFNFRGVGLSEGEYDAGIGESEDMLVLAQQLQHLAPATKLLFAGFSFGGFVAYRAAAQTPHALLLTVAPPVNHFDFEAFDVMPSPWILLQGDEDEVIPPSLVFQFAAQYPISVLEFAETGHFFHGKLTELKTRVSKVLEDILV